MKMLFSLLALAMLANSAQADVDVPLKCASQKDQTLYYTQGQLLLTINHVAHDELIFGTNLTLAPEKKLGDSKDKSIGKVSRDGKYVRFEIGADAWCNYRLTLPRGFHERFNTIPAFVDAYCEENSNYSIRLNCRIK